MLRYLRKPLALACVALALPYMLNRSAGEDAPEMKRANRKERYPSDEAEIVYQGGTSIGVVIFLGDEIEPRFLGVQRAAGGTYASDEFHGRSKEN